jgi:hypothetical protein
MYSLSFYLWVLHPVAHLSNWSLVTPSIATKFQYVSSPFFIFLLTHYMFRISNTDNTSQKEETKQ